MRPFFFVLVITLTGAARGSERVEVESGKSVNISIETPGGVRRVTLEECKTTGHPIILYCFPEEKKNGCSAEKSDRFTITTDSGGFSVTLVEARFSDEGCYRLSFIDFDNVLNYKEFTVKVHEQPSSTSTSTVTPPSSTNSPPSSIIVIAVGIAVGIVVGIIVGTAAVILTIIGVRRIIKHRTSVLRKKNNACEDPMEMASLSSTSREATGESTEMVDETESSVDNTARIRKIG